MIIKGQFYIEPGSLGLNLSILYPVPSIMLFRASVITYNAFAAISSTSCKTSLCPFPRYHRYRLDNPIRGRQRFSSYRLSVWMTETPFKPFSDTSCPVSLSVSIITEFPAAFEFFLYCRKVQAQQIT